MKRNVWSIGARALCVAIAFWSVAGMLPTVQAQYDEASAPQPGADKTLSPYFFVNGEASGEALPLQSTRAEVSIAGVIADVRVTQVYQNRGSTPLEATYIFPGSTQAAVYGMKMTIGDRVRTAKIREKKAAQQEYQQAKKAGKSASLLEQHRPNVFKMSVANILPGDQVTVELNYTEQLVPTDGVYDFAYPTVVGPRYSNRLAATAGDEHQWVANPFTKQGESPSYEFDIKVRLLTGIPIKDLLSTSHDVKINYRNSSEALIELAGTERFGGNRDYILKYRLDGGAVESGLLLYEGEKENFFLLMMQPPERVAPEEIPGREYVFVVDVSGSMNGFPLQVSKTLMRELVANLRPTDQLNVILFAGVSALFAPTSVQATEENLERVLEFIDDQEGSGGTELLPALKQALSLPRTENVSRSIVLVTDGYVDIETDCFDLLRRNLGNANFFAFGIGSSINRHLIEGLARVGHGEPFMVTQPELAPVTATLFREYIQSPVLTQVRIDYGSFEVYDVEPLHVPDLLAARPVLAYGKWRGRPQGTIALHGVSGVGAYEAKLDVSAVRPTAENEALRYLWARHRIQRLGDYNRLRANDERIQEITTLGLTYNLLTQYTSFIAVDELVRNPGGEQTTAKQPLPLPKGVSDLAVGQSIPTVPEPETWAMLILGLLVVSVAYFRREELQKWER